MHEKHPKAPSKWVPYGNSFHLLPSGKPAVINATGLATTDISTVLAPTLTPNIAIQPGPEPIRVPQYLDSLRHYYSLSDGREMASFTSLQPSRWPQTSIHLFVYYENQCPPCISYGISQSAGEDPSVRLDRAARCFFPRHFRSSWMRVRVRDALVTEDGSIFMSCFSKS